MGDFRDMARDPKHRRAFEKLLYLAAKRGDADLVQERLGPDHFAYLAITRPKPKHAEVSLASLLVDAEAEAA